MYRENRVVKFLYALTPLGKADQLLRNNLEFEDGEKFQNYNNALNAYRSAKSLHLFSKLLLYASVVASAAAVIGLELDLLERVASYIGVSVILIMYLATSYIAMRNREIFHLQRELLIAERLPNKTLKKERE